MMILNIYGHVIIISIGIPIITGLVISIREIRKQCILLLNIDKMKADYEALIQIVTFQQMIQDAKVSQDEDITLIGIVNLHVLECQNQECPCKNEAILYDITTSKFTQRNGKLTIL